MTAARRPDPFADTFLAMAAARAVLTATRLGVLAALDEQPSDARGLADRLGLDPAGTEALLAALESLGYVEAEGGAHRATAAARAAVAIGDFVGAYAAHEWDMLGRLDAVLQGLEPARSHERPPSDTFWDGYIRGLYQLSRDSHDDYAAAVPVRDPRALLDVAGGHGGFSMAMCRRHPELRATVLDLPASVHVGRAIVEEEGMADRVSFREGDALGDELGSGHDAISVFNLLHHLTPDAVCALLERARAALAPGGWIVVGETEHPRPGETTLEGALGGLVYFASSGTRNYSQDELRGWLEGAGFADVRVERAPRAPWRLLYLARA